jgi:hypothetical protein
LKHDFREMSRPLPEYFVTMLAEHAHVATREIEDMVSKCILCSRDSAVSVVGIDRKLWRRKSKLGKLAIMLCGLCKPCSDLPNAVEKAKAATIRECTILLN